MENTIVPKEGKQQKKTMESRRKLILSIDKQQLCRPRNLCAIAPDRKREPPRTPLASAAVERSDKHAVEFHSRDIPLVWRHKRDSARQHLLQCRKLSAS